MCCLGKLIGISLLFTFVVVFPCSMWTYNTQRIALREETYKDLFTDEGFYQDLIPAVLPDLFKGLNEGEPAPGEVSLTQVIDRLDSKKWDKIASDLVPAEWVESEVETNLDAFFGWLKGDRNDLVIVFHTDVLRRRLLGQPGRDAVQQIIAALPVCTPDQEQQFVSFIYKTEGVEFPYCQPSQADLRSTLADILTRSKDDLANILPTELNVMEEMETHAHESAAAQGEQVPKEVFSHAALNEFRASIRLWQRLLILVFLIPMALLSLIVIFAVRSSKSFFRWMGWALMIGSLFTLIPLLFLPLTMPSLSNRSQGEVEQGFASGGALVAEILGNGMMRLVIGEFTRPVLEQSAILIGLSFLFLFLSILLPDPDAWLAAPPASYTIAYQTPAGLVIPESPTHLGDTPPPDRTPPPSNPTGDQ